MDLRALRSLAEDALTLLGTDLSTAPPPGELDSPEQLSRLLREFLVEFVGMEVPTP